MIKKYISRKHTLILVVRPTFETVDTALALELAKEADPKRERTLEVITHCDIFRSDSQRDLFKSTILNG